MGSFIKTNKACEANKVKKKHRSILFLKTDSSDRFSFLGDTIAIWRTHANNSHAPYRYETKCNVIYIVKIK